jgi:hypothetical protein
MKRSMFALMLITGIAFAPAFAGEPAFVYDPHNARDPFLPLVTAGGAIVTYDTEFAVSEMMLEGIVSDSGGRIAIINGNIVELGKMIGLYMVQDIQADRVILLRDGKMSVLQLKKEE